jgi:hypothetical protein
MRAKLYLSLLIGVLLCLVGWSAHAELQSSSKATRAWEYTSREVQDNAEQLNELGAEGWELVAVDCTRSSNTCRYVFKRAK